MTVILASCCKSVVALPKSVGSHRVYFEGTGVVQVHGLGFFHVSLERSCRFCCGHGGARGRLVMRQSCYWQGKGLQNAVPCSASLPALPPAGGLLPAPALPGKACLQRRGIASADATGCLLRQRFSLLPNQPFRLLLW